MASAAQSTRSKRSTVEPLQRIMNRHDRALADLEKTIRANYDVQSADAINNHITELKLVYGVYIKAATSLVDKFKATGSAQEASAAHQERRMYSLKVYEEIEGANLALTVLGEENASLKTFTYAATDVSETPSQRQRSLEAQQAEERRIQEEEAELEHQAQLKALESQSQLANQEAEKKKLQAEQEAKFQRILAEATKAKINADHERAKLARRRASLEQSREVVNLEEESSQHRTQNYVNTLPDNPGIGEVDGAAALPPASSAPGLPVATSAGIHLSLPSGAAPLVAQSLPAASAPTTTTSIPITLFAPSQPTTCTGAVPKPSRGNTLNVTTSSFSSFNVATSSLPQRAQVSLFPSSGQLFTTVAATTASSFPNIFKTSPAGYSNLNPGATPYLPSGSTTIGPAPWFSVPPPPLPTLTPVTGPSQTPAAAAPALDSSAVFLAKRDLLNKPPNPFAGTGMENLFDTWKSTLGSRMAGLSLSPIEEISILLANTTGDALKVVQIYHAASGNDPAKALGDIWSELKTRFGSDAKIAAGLRKKLHAFPSIKEGPNMGKQIRELRDVCHSVNSNIPTVDNLKVMDYQEGQRPVVEKLPNLIATRWRKYGTKYQAENFDKHPPFSIFLKFLNVVVGEFCNDSFDYIGTTRRAEEKSKPVTTSRVLITTTEEDTEEETTKLFCPLHSSPYHSLATCRSFIRLSPDDRKEKAKTLGVCLTCLGRHARQDCTNEDSCSKCGKKGHHITLCHKNKKPVSATAPNPSKPASATSTSKSRSPPTISTPKSSAEKGTEGKETTNMCTQVCGNDKQGKSCSKTLLVEIKAPGSSKTLRCYAILDEQSTTTFAAPEVFDFFQLDAVVMDYTVSTLSGHKTQCQGRVFEGLTVKGIKESTVYELPKVYCTDLIPDTKDEVATPLIVRQHPHIAHLANKFPKFNKAAQVLLLIGRDSDNLLKTESHGDRAPFAHHTSLGWAVVGNVCVNKKSSLNFKVLRTSLEPPELPTDLKPCFPSAKGQFFLPEPPEDAVFVRQPDDELPGLSVEDQRFLTIIGNGIHTNELGNLEMPLPFKKDDPSLPSNQSAVFRRTSSTLTRLKDNPDKLEDCLKAMGKTLSAGYIEVVPADQQKPKDGKAWWIPVFPVVHPRKLKVRLVFDGSAVYYGASLNDSLLQGPDQNNRLKGVLLRFREGKLGFMADVEAMFHSFFLNPEHRDFLRFYWFKDNDASNELIQYRAKVHIFGNRPSPAIAIFGLRHAAQNSKAKEATQNFIRESFYVDDGLGTSDTVEEAISILQEARSALAAYNIRLHKIASSSQDILEAFPESERAEDLAQVDFDDAPMQRTLGITWDVKTDSFLIHVDIQERPFTKRGVLSIVNSIFDPLGIVSPIGLEGKLIMRAIMSPSNKPAGDQVYDWDDPLPATHLERWKNWKSQLVALNQLQVPRGFISKSFGETQHRELHVFSDASEEAIGHVIYVRSVDDSNNVSVSFVFGNSKVAPRLANSIPRLELCASVEAAQAARELLQELVKPIDKVYYYTDSKVVLGYLSNTERRFSKYVTRRVALINSLTNNSTWNYVTTDTNPADMASRPHTPAALMATTWLQGPPFLSKLELPNDTPLSLPPEQLPELQEEPAIKVMVTSSTTTDGLFSSIVDKFSSWPKMVRVADLVISAAKKWLTKTRQKLHRPEPGPSKLSNKSGKQELIRLAQGVVYRAEVELLLKDRTLPKGNQLHKLAPFIDDDGILRVGGRLKLASLPFDSQHPILLPPEHPLSHVLILFFHSRVQHQGRHLTLGALRDGGFHLMNASRVLAKFLSNCSICRELRGTPATQQMANLPPDRLEATAPFTNTGLDVFGPFHIHEGQATRRTSATKKTWALLFTCLASRAVHIELLPHLDTPTFKNALRRFLAKRGSCKLLRSDRGTNFVGAERQDEANVSLDELKNSMAERDCQWEFNPPHSSHFGGVWERKIGAIRRVLEGALVHTGNRPLSRDELDTLLQEAAAIVNATPLWEVSTDPNDPRPLSPSTLLTLKEEPHRAAPDDFTDQDLLAYGSRRWRRVQALADHFWKTWRQQYLQGLQSRRKWANIQRSIQPGDIVLLRDKLAKRNEWPMARVINVKKSSDGHVRSAHIEVARSDKKNNVKKYIYVRPVSELVLLIPREEDKTQGHEDTHKDS